MATKVSIEQERVQKHKKDPELLAKFNAYQRIYKRTYSKLPKQVAYQKEYQKKYRLDNLDKSQHIRNFGIKRIESEYWPTLELKTKLNAMHSKMPNNLNSEQLFDRIKNPELYIAINKALNALHTQGLKIREQNEAIIIKNDVKTSQNQAEMTSNQPDIF